MLSVLVTGGNRGVGLGFVREFLKEDSVGAVIATARNVEAAKELKSINNRKLHIVQCDIVDEYSIAAAAAKVAGIVNGQGLDILINNAGIYPHCSILLAGPVSKSAIMEQLEVNAVGPLLVANKFHALLKRAAELRGSAQVANITSACGSLSMATNTDHMPPAIYAMAKAALNMLTRKICLEWKKDGIRATAFTPGWVASDMGGPGADRTVEEATAPLTRLILSLTEEHNGNFYRLTGEQLPW